MMYNVLITHIAYLMHASVVIYLYVEAGVILKHVGFHLYEASIIPIVLMGQSLVMSAGALSSWILWCSWISHLQKSYKGFNILQRLLPTTFDTTIYLNIYELCSTTFSCWWKEENSLFYHVGYLIIQRSFFGGILVSLRPSVRPSRVRSLYSSGWIHFIFMHLI